MQVTSRIFLGLVLLFIAFESNAQVSTRRNYQQVVEFINRVQRENSANSKVISIGKSGTGEDIIALKIGNGPVQNLIVGTHHGNEYGSTEVALAAAEDLAKRPLPDQTIFVLPVLNISGYNLRRREETVVSNLMSTATARTADPNRDYPGPCGSDGPFLLKSTKALADFVERENIVAVATLHTFYGSVCYPWGISSHDLKTRDEAEFIRIANAAAATSGYEVGNSTEIMYPADGTFEDYSYWKLGTWSLLFEMGSSHSPSERQLQQLVTDNVPGLRLMMEKAPRQRATNHQFEGRCDTRLRSLDLRNE